MAGQLTKHQVAHLLELTEATPTTFIVVDPEGDDTEGVGSFAKPYKTLTKAFTKWTAARCTIYVLSGSYAEAHTLTWPDINNLYLVGLGPVSVSNADGAAQVLLIAPGSAATSSFNTNIKDINFSHNTQIGIKIANVGMTKKLMVALDGVSMDMGTSGDCIDVAGTVSGQAIRLYGKRLVTGKGLFHFTVNDAGSRLRIADSVLAGGLTTVGAVASEVTLRNTQILTGGLTVAAEQKLTNVGVVYATEADPAVYTNLANAFATY